MGYKILLKDIVDSMAGKVPYTPSESRKFLDIILGLFQDYLKSRNRIELRGLGTFFVKEHKSKHIELKTKIIDSKNHFVILFKESTELSKKLNENREKSSL